MEKYYSHFNADIPELVDQLTKFIVEVNEFLLNLTRDERYSSSRTRGKSPCSNVTFEDDPWSFQGERHRGNAPLVDYATISFRGGSVWTITRSSKLLCFKEANNVQRCLQGAAKNYRPELPWCGPEEFYDSKTGLTYRAICFGEDKAFFISEAIYTPEGVLIWRATCKGGYV